MPDYPASFSHSVCSPQTFKKKFSVQFCGIFVSTIEKWTHPLTRQLNVAQVVLDQLDGLQKHLDSSFRIYMMSMLLMNPAYSSSVSNDSDCHPSSSAVAPEPVISALPPAKRATRNASVAQTTNAEPVLHR